MPGSARSCPQIHSRYGSSFDTAGDRAYLGGDSAANARRIVLRCSPVRLLISRIDNRSTPRMRLTSAHCSTPTTPSSSPDHRDQARVRTRPDEPDPAPGGPLLDRRRWTTIHPAPTLCEGDLRGMFDGPTTPGLRLDGRAVILDLSAFFDSSALGLVMTCAAAWQRGMIVSLHAEAQREERTPRKMINVIDEAWRALAVLGVGEWLQTSFKLSRRDGVPNVVIMHRL